MLYWLSSFLACIHWHFKRDGLVPDFARTQVYILTWYGPIQIGFHANKTIWRALRSQRQQRVHRIWSSWLRYWPPLAKRHEKAGRPKGWPACNIGCFDKHAIITIDSGFCPAVGLICDRCYSSHYNIRYNFPALTAESIGQGNNSACYFSLR